MPPNCSNEVSYEGVLVMYLRVLASARLPLFPKLYGVKLTPYLLYAFTNFLYKSYKNISKFPPPLWGGLGRGLTIFSTLPLPLPSRGNLYDKMHIFHNSFMLLHLRTRIFETLLSQYLLMHQLQFVLIKALLQKHP